MIVDTWLSTFDEAIDGPGFRIAAAEDLSRDTRDIVTRTLA